MGPIQQELRKIPGMNCFFCSPAELNPDGLNLVFSPSPGGARTEFTLARKFQSYPGMGHGGILSGILDETMAYAGIFELRCLPVTKMLRINFRAKVPSLESNSCEARVVSRSKNEFAVEAMIRGANGLRLMTASATFAILSRRAAEKLLCTSKLEALGAYFSS
ncbi:MAG: PaaI family thioesterase [Deltaproteobacteria bacterium]|nr:PaaI family thioesterase [Deltaproteobacteria bacterium]